MEYNSTDSNSIHRMATRGTAPTLADARALSTTPTSGFVPWPTSVSNVSAATTTTTTAAAMALVSPTMLYQHGGPQPFAVWQVVIIGVLVGALSLATVSGNVLVLMSFYIERAIRQPTNYFIASLAISDLLIGLLSMPLYTQYLIVQEWRLGEFVCDLWLSLDYTVCLASQYTVLLITIDRFCSIKFPARYRNWRSEQKVRVMVVVAWFIPGGLFFTCIIGWQYFVGERTVKSNTCEVQFLQNPVFNTALIFSYYWSSLIVLILLYAAIYKVAYDLQKKSEAKQKRMSSMVAMAGNAMTKMGIGISKTQSTLLSTGSVGGGGGGAATVERAPRQSASNQSLAAAGGGAANNAANSKRPSNKSETTSFVSRQDDSQERSSSPTYPSDDDDSSSEEKKKKKRTKKNRADDATAVKPQKRQKHAKEKPARKEKKGKTPPRDQKAVVADGRRCDSRVSVSSTPPASLVEATPPRLPPLSEELTWNTTAEESDRDAEAAIPALPPAPQRSSSGFDICYSAEGLKIAYIDQESLKSDPSLGSICRSPSYPFTPPSSKEGTPASFKESSPRPKEVGSKEGSPTVVTLPKPGRGTVTRIARPDEVALLKEGTPPRYDGSDPEGGGGGGAGGGTVKNGKTVTPERDNLLRSLRPRSRRHRPKKAKREKSKSENRARKALRTITCIMGAFVLCWTPWHVLATIIGFCSSCVSEDLYAFTYWLCYMNSPLNPFMYALANAQFKKTFIRMLRGDFERR